MTIGYQPTEADQQTAREIVKRCGVRDGLFKGPRTFNAVETIAYALLDARRAALSSRDTQIREVLEGLATHQIGSRRPCWCPPDYGSEPHLPACLAARGLWERVQSE